MTTGSSGIFRYWGKARTNGQGPACHLVSYDCFAVTSGRRAPDREGAKARGEPLGDVLDRFLAAIGPDVETLVAHNLAFDRNIVGAELARLGFSQERIRESLLGRPGICTMRASTSFCRIPGRCGKHKFPTLAELHRRLFGEEPAGGHTALADVTVTARCFFELKRTGVVG